LFESERASVDVDRRKPRTGHAAAFDGWLEFALALALLCSLTLPASSLKYQTMKTTNMATMPEPEKTPQIVI